MSLLRFAIISQRQILVRLLLCVIFFVVSSSIEAIADDPLNAFPTAEDTVDDKVKRLTQDELNNIRIPEDGDGIIFSVEVEKASKDDSKDTRKLIELLQVYADGRIVCDSSAGFNSPFVVKSVEDSISRAELDWLLHLAINECELLKLSTEEIEDRYQAIKDKPPSDTQKRFHYSIKLVSGENKLAIPEEALVYQPLRKEMNLDSLASLHNYFVFLIDRAYLGDSKERQLLLTKLNSKLQAEHPEAPPFRMEHLFAAVVFSHVPTDFGKGLVAQFQQEIEKEKFQFRKFNGRIIKKGAEAEPEITIWINEFERKFQRK